MIVPAVAGRIIGAQPTPGVMVRASAIWIGLSIALVLAGCHSSGRQAVRTPAMDGGVSALQGPLLGDMDGDGHPGVGDAIAILRIVVGLAEYSVFADVDQSGDVGVNDAILVLRCVVGLAPWPVDSPARLWSIGMEPVEAELEIGETLEITATGRDQHGERFEFSPRWEVVGDIGTIAPALGAAQVQEATYVFTATTAGTGAIRCSDDAAQVSGEVTVTVSDAGAIGPLCNILFLHHSTGYGFIEEGNMRGAINAFNAANDTDFTLWDHGYNYEGLRDPFGVETGVSYDIPGDNTDPVGLAELWTTDNGARQQIMANHEIVVFKSCFPASAIGDDEQLAQYRAWFLQMREYFDRHPEKLFIACTTPPLHRLETNRAEAARARRWAEYLASDEYLAGHPNVAVFDIFDMLARADDGSATANMLRYEYEQSHSGADSHPNRAANQVVGPAMAEFICNAAMGYSP